MKKKILLGIGSIVLILSAYVGWQIHRAGGAEELIEMGCAQSCQYDGEDYNKNSDLVAQPGTKIGDFTTCPVSKVVLKVSEESPSVAYKGKKYYTCCVACTKLASNNPTKYLTN